MSVYFNLEHPNMFAGAISVFPHNLEVKMKPSN